VFLSIVSLIPNSRYPILSAMSRLRWAALHLLRGAPVLPRRAGRHAIALGEAGALGRARGCAPWGVATIDLKTLGCGHQTLFLSLHPQLGGENSYDDRTGRVYACLSMGQAGARQDAHHGCGNKRLGWAVSPGRPTRHRRRTDPGLASRAGRSCRASGECGAGGVVRLLLKRRSVRRSSAWRWLA
jgi:hypothetical protein